MWEGPDHNSCDQKEQEAGDGLWERKREVRGAGEEREGKGEGKEKGKGSKGEEAGGGLYGRRALQKASTLSGPKRRRMR
jgi:hypothetical protein